MRTAAAQVMHVVRVIGLWLLMGCCEQQKLPSGSVLMSEETAARLAEICRISNLNTEQELLVLGITDYLKDLHLKPGEDRQDCRVQRNQACGIASISCAPNQAERPAPAHCRELLAGPPPEDEKPIALPCGCGGSKRSRKYYWFDFDMYSLTELDRLVLDTHAGSRSNALAKMITHYEEQWTKRLKEPGFADSPASRPRLRRPGSTCPASIHYERLMHQADASAK